MPIVKFIEIESNLPADVFSEMTRYTSGRYIPIEEYSQYRDAALALHKRGKIKFSREKLYSLAESVRQNYANNDETVLGEKIYRDFVWSISNTHGNSHSNNDTFEASLFSWRKNDEVEEHPAILMLTLISRFEKTK